MWPCCTTDGPAFFGDRKSEYELIQRAHTNKHIGTRHEWMITTVRKEGLFCYVNNRSSLHEIKHFLELGLPVIVHFSTLKEDEGHYSLVVGIVGNNVLFNDPWDGKNFKISQKDFISHWYGKQEERSYTKWIMVVSDKDLELGKQYHPLVKTLR